MENNNENNLPISPDWSTAPDWAQWWAVDQDGKGYWYETKPDMGNILWLPSLSSGRYDRSGRYMLENWKNSLQKRPDNV